jgi:hypothetical protein
MLVRLNQKMPVTVIAAALEPRFKNMQFLPDELRAHTVAQLQKLVQEINLESVCIIINSY